MHRALCLALVLTASLVSAQRSEVDADHTKWIARVIDEIQTLKPGMTRKDLVHVFETEGGISTRRQRTYVYRQCPYIKVTVEFEPVDNYEDIQEMPMDKITKISR